VSTAPRGKLTLYGRLGVREYYVYAPAALAPPRLRAFTLQGDGDEMRLEEVAPRPNGGVWSPLLRAELRPAWTSGTEWEPAGTYLRVIDPTTDAPVRVGDEVRQDYQAAREQVISLQEQLTREEQARQDAEERARRAEAELEMLRAMQTRPDQ